MTQIAAICISLLKGEVLDIGTGFNKFHCTNLPRELSRSVEQKFGVEIRKIKTAFKSQYDGKAGFYFKYRLNNTEFNADGRKRMVEYVKSQLPDKPLKTDEEAKKYKQLNMWLQTL